MVYILCAVQSVINMSLINCNRKGIKTNLFKYLRRSADKQTVALRYFTVFIILNLLCKRFCIIVYVLLAVRILRFPLKAARFACGFLVYLRKLAFCVLKTFGKFAYVFKITAYRARSCASNSVNALLTS